MPGVFAMAMRQDNVSTEHHAGGYRRWRAESSAWALTNTIAVEKKADTLATRIVLNIAESNGRYASLSRQTFLDTANAAAAKLAVFLDMAVRRGILDNQEVGTGKELLVRIGQMTARKDYPAR
jgi:hypothetical protein